MSPGLFLALGNINSSLSLSSYLNYIFSLLDNLRRTQVQQQFSQKTNKTDLSNSPLHLPLRSLPLSCWDRCVVKLGMPMCRRMCKCMEEPYPCDCYKRCRRLKNHKGIQFCVWICTGQKAILVDEEDWKNRSFYEQSPSILIMFHSSISAVIR